MGVAKGNQLGLPERLRERIKMVQSSLKLLYTVATRTEHEGVGVELLASQERERALQARITTLSQIAILQQRREPLQQWRNLLTQSTEFMRQREWQKKPTAELRKQSRGQQRLKGEPRRQSRGQQRLTGGIRQRTNPSGQSIGRRSSSQEKSLGREAGQR